MLKIVFFKSMLCVCIGDVMDVLCLYCEAWTCRCSCMGVIMIVCV